MPLDPSQVQWDDSEPAAKPRLRYDAPELDAYADEVETRYGLPTGLVKAIKNHGERSNSWQVSPAGARGVMQFMPQNLEKYGVTDPEDPYQMIDAAGRYLRDTSQQYGGNVEAMIADYNGGPRQAKRVLAGQRPAAAETDAYLTRVLGALGIGSASAGAMPAPAQIQWDAAPAIDAGAVQWDEPAAVAEPSYLGGIGDAVSNLFSGDAPLPARLRGVEEAVIPDLVQGARGRALQLASSLTRGIANIGEPVGDYLETNVSISGLTPEQIQGERQLQPMYSLADTLAEAAKADQYTPTATFEDVKRDPLSSATARFIGEQVALSTPDMLASVFALPAYMLGRTEEIGERRVANDGRTGEPTLGDLGAAAPGAIAESLLERYATKRLPGAAPGGSAVGNVLRETAVQAGTEALEEGAANLGESVGTERGVDVGELFDAMGAGALVGGPLGGGVRTVTEIADAVRGPRAEVDTSIQPTSIDAADVQWDGAAAPQQETAQSVTEEAPDTEETAAEPAQTMTADAAPVEAAEPAGEPTAAAESEIPTSTRQRFSSPDDLARADFVQRAVQRGVAEDVATELAPRAAIDDVTGYVDGRAQGVKSATVERAQEHVRDTGESAFYVDGDIVNLGGLNKAAKDDMTVANRHFRAMTDILRGELEAIGADVVPMRTGGDELGAVVVNSGEAEIRSAMQAADAKIRAYATQNGLDTIPHTKQGRTDVGVGLHLGLSPIVPGVATNEIFSRASAEVNQSKEGVNVTRHTTAGTGAVASEGQPEGVERGADQDPAGLRPEDRGTARAEGAPDAEAARGARAPEGVAADAPLLERIDNDRSAVPDGQEDAPEDGGDVASREAVELEDGSESPVERNTRGKGSSDEFRNASFTNRRSWQQAAFRDAGLDPDQAELLPIDKQFDAIAKATKDKFGITIAKTKGVPPRMAVDSALDLYRNAEMMAHVLGMPVKAIGLGDSLTLLFRDQMPYLGAMYPGGGTVEGVKIPAGSIALPRRSNSFAHEWGHALDLFLVGKYGLAPDAGLVTRQVRNDGIDATPETSRAAFANLMNAMFFDEAALAIRVAALQQAAENGTEKQQAAAKQALEKLARGNSKLQIQGTQYLISSKAFGASTGGKSGAQYFADPAELMARAFEAYVAERVESAGGSTEVLTKGDSAYLSNNDTRFALTFPKTADRVRIFAAFDDLFAQLGKEQLVAQGAAAGNPGNIDTFDPRLWLGDAGRAPEYRGLKGAWKEQADQWNAHREQSRREAARPADPMSRKARIQNALMAWTTPVQGVFRTMERRYPGSKSVRDLANKLVTAPGINRTVGRVYEQAVRITMGRGYNQFGNIVDRYQLNRLDEAGRQTLRRLLVSAADPDKAPANLVKAAAELRRFMDTLWYDNQEAGINIGYAPNGYLPRITDLAMIQAEPEAFVEAAAKAYAINLAKDEAIDPAQVQELAEAQARAWLFNLTSAPAMDFGSKTPAENYTKHRSLPAEADVLLEKFYVADPLEVIHRYIGMSARNTEFAKSFGPKGEQLNDMFEKMADEGVQLEDQKYLQGSVSSLLGRQPAGVLDGKPRAQALMNQVNAYGVMSMLGRVVISSIAEPGMAGIRTGSTAAVYKPYFNLFKQAIGTADMKQWREITRAIGLIGDAQADMVVQARLGGTYESTPKTDARLARYFALTGLHALTNAQRVSLMPVTHRYLAQLVDQVRVGSPAEAKEGRALLAELGIANPAAFRIDTAAPKMTDLFDRNGRETEFGAQYMTAMSRINEQIVQAPNRYDRPEMANSPTGRFLYGIMSFNLAFWNNVYKREAAVISRQAKERGALGVASYVGGHLAPPLIAYFFTQMLVTAAREALLNPQRWEEWDRDDTLVKNLTLLTLSRAFPMGLFDIPIQAYQGLKYQRDITSIAVGAVPSYFLMSAQKVASAFRDENSEKTNNAEFSAMQGAYQLLANPLIAHLLTSLPGGRVLDPIYGVTLAVGTSAAARDQAAQAVVGERDSLVAKRARDERRAEKGVESAGERGSSRASVRNTDQRGSTR